MTLQVCLNGHKITEYYDSSPTDRSNYCDKCGAETIYQCPTCKEKIRGHKHLDGIVVAIGTNIPSNCHACGKPYPFKSKSKPTLEPEVEATPEPKNKNNDEAFIETIFQRFPLVVTQLKVRREDRPTLNVDDEYDVQDLLHSLLKINYDDIRPEEWNPSYGGSSTKSDFLLKDEKIIIEVKHTRKGLTNIKLKEELIIDKDQYKQNQHCKTMCCFVYDPDNRIENPRGFEKDLQEESDDFTCKVVIVS